MKNTECIVFERTRDTEPKNPRAVCVFVSPVLIPSSTNRRVDLFASFASYTYSCRIYSLEFFIADRLRYGKTGNKKCATLPQNELNSDVTRFTTNIKPVIQQIRLLTGLNVSCKTRNNTIQLVLQQCCKTLIPAQDLDPAFYWHPVQIIFRKLR